MKNKMGTLLAALLLLIPRAGAALTPTPTATPTMTPTVTATSTPVSSCCQGVTDLTGLPGHPLNGTGMSVDYANHRLYVADFTGNDIQVFNSDTNSPVTLFSALNSGHLIEPIDTALDGAGNLYVAAEGNGAVEKFDSNFNFVCSIGQSLGMSVVGVWADSDAVYFSTLQNVIFEFSGSGSAYSMAASFGGGSGLSNPNEMVKVGNELYVADTFNGRIVKFDVTNPSAAAVVVQSSLFSPSGLRLDLAGNFYVAESDNGGVAQFVDRFDPTFTTEESQCPLVDVWGAAVNAEGEVFVSGFNSFAVTELAGCVTEPTLTPTASPTPSYLGPNPPASGTCFIYPSPAPKGGQAHVVYDMTGPGRMKLILWNEAAEKVAEVTDTKPAGNQSTPFSLAGLAPGVYFYSVTLSYDSGSTQKIRVQKFAISP